MGRFEAFLLAPATDKQLADPLHCERVKNVGLGTVVAMLGFFGEVFEGSRLGLPLISAVAATAVLLFLGGIFLLRSSQRFALTGHLILSVVLAAMSINLIAAGGFENPAIVALFILPIGGAVLISTRASIAWGLLSGLALVGFWIASTSGVDFGAVPGGAGGLNALINRGIVLAGIVIMISIFVRGQSRSEHRLRSAFNHLEEQASFLEDQAAHLELLKEAAVAANEATTLHEAVSKCVENICVTKGWPLAHAYDLSTSSDEPNLSKPVLYVDPAVAANDRRLVHDAFNLLADGNADATNPDLPQQNKQVRWDSKLSSSANPYRRALAEQLGLSARVLVFVDIGDRKWLVEFFSREALEPDESFVDVLRNTGTQLSRVLERTRSRSRIHDLSYSDALTGLPNRRHLNESLETMLTGETRELLESGDDTQLGLLQIGIDRFKVINDALGHQVGDKLLRKVADRLLGVVAATDRADGEDLHHSDRVFRVGGDEFAIVLGNVTAPAKAALLAQRILDRLAQPMLVNGREIFTTASVGISIAGIDASEGLSLLRCADSALAAAKKTGGGKVRFYAASLNEQSSRRLFIENRLRRAIKRDELALAYQPLIASQTGEIIAAEALLRWTSDGQFISPAEFIPVAESSGQIGSLGRWVLETACLQLSNWLKNNNGPGRLAVNVSVEQLREKNFVEFVTRLIEFYRLPVAALELEITESVLIGSEPEIFDRLEQLRDAGANLALDDFGTGYSSLSQLKRLPITKLKIDRSFVDGIESDASNLALVEAVVQIGRNLGLTIVAEGVENKEQAAILCETGADELQGYHFCRPVPASEFEAKFASPAKPTPKLRPTIRGLAPMVEAVG